MPSNPEQAIKLALSAPRLSTYEAATTVAPALSGAIALYTWNARLSAALMFPLHVCEVTVRNAVSDALTQVYGADWPWSAGFIASLTNPPPPTYSPKRDLLKVGSTQGSTGKVIAELKFKFWETMFTGRFDARLWNPHLRTVMPFIAAAMTVQQAASGSTTTWKACARFATGLRTMSPSSRATWRVTIRRLGSSSRFDVLIRPRGCKPTRLHRG